jgi:hypothetical protein
VRDHAITAAIGNVVGVADSMSLTVAVRARSTLASSARLARTTSAAAASNATMGVATRHDWRRPAVLRIVVMSRAIVSKTL